LAHIRAGEIELWLRSLPLARSSCAKIRNVMSVLFNHGLRHELLERNPVRWVRQSAKRKKIPAVLEIEEVQMLLGALDVRERTIAPEPTNLRLRRAVGQVEGPGERQCS